MNSFHIALVAAFLWFWGAMCPREAQAEVANRIVAIVNDDILTEGDVVPHLNALLQQGDPQATGEDEQADMRHAVLQRLIEERLIIQEAKRMGLTVGAQEVAERLREIRGRFDTQEAYEQMLRESSLSEEQLKIKIREQLLAQQAIDHQVRSKILLSPSETTKAAHRSALTPNPGEEVRAYHLLIRLTEERSAGQALAFAKGLYDQLRKGAEFEELAREFSEDSRAQDGGLLGWVHQGELLPELDQTIFRLQPGELSEPIQTRLGFHLVKVVERRSLSDVEVSELRRRLAQEVYQAKFAKALEEWLAELKQKAYIQILDE